MDFLDHLGVGYGGVGGHGLMFLCLDFAGVGMLDGFAHQAEGLLGQDQVVLWDLEGQVTD